MSRPAILRRVSLAEETQIEILDDPDIWMDGYNGFCVRYRGGKAFHRGGVFWVEGGRKGTVPRCSGCALPASGTTVANQGESTMRPITAIALAHLVPSPASARFPCNELGGERNAVYKDAGYCFKTARGIQAFGNAGCRYDNIADVPLSQRDRAKVSDIQRQERANNCPP